MSDEQVNCDACGEVDDEGPLIECPRCGKMCCHRCIMGVGVVCCECEEANEEDD